VLVLIFTMALGALALSAIFMSSSATVAARTTGRDSDLRYTADAAINVVKSYLNTDPAALPESSFREFVFSGRRIPGADGQPVSGASVRVWFGPTGSTTTGGTSFATIVAETRDPNGGRVVRSMQATRESFAKYAYYSTRETYQGTAISFAAGNVLFGPVWSNDMIRVASGTPRPEFRDSVWTASTVNNAGAGTFLRGYLENQAPIFLPNTSTLARLRVIAQRGRLAFDAPTNGDERTARMRVEFLTVDLNGDGDATDEDEGFARVYEADNNGIHGNVNGVAWLRGDYTPGPYPGSGTSSNSQRATQGDRGTNCGDWHVMDASGVSRFYPIAVHRRPNFVTQYSAWLRQVNPLLALVTANSQAAAHGNEEAKVILQGAGARCFLGGDPHLSAVEISDTASFGGDSSTFAPGGFGGAWRLYPGAVTARLAAARATVGDAAYLFPISRAYADDVRGVMQFNGTVGISGVINGKLTLHATGHIVILDDVTYAVPPGGITPTGEPNCDDIFGMVSNQDIVVADNALLTPVDHDDKGTTVERPMKPNPGLFVHGISMAINTSFRVENYDAGPTTAVPCLGQPRGRGCLNVDGGILQLERGPVGLVGAQGFTKRYAYDRCGAKEPPPYFPTTGRYADNRVTEIDPVGFDVQRWFEERQVGN
jgi:hypothetical protein